MLVFSFHRSLLLLLIVSFSALPPSIAQVPPPLPDEVRPEPPGPKSQSPKSSDSLNDVVDHANGASTSPTVLRRGPFLALSSSSCRYLSMNEPAGFSGSVGHDGHTGYSRSSAAQFGPSGYNENASNQDAYKPFGFSTQAGTTRSPEPAGYGESNDQFAAQTRPMGPSGHTENARYQGAYEPNGFSAQSSSTRIPDHFVHQSRQWSQHQSGQWSQHQSGQWSQHQNGQWSQPGRPEDASHQGIRQPAEPVHEQDGYARSLNMSNR